MNTATLALLTAIAALLATGLVAAVVVRGRRSSDRRLTDGLLEVGARMDGLARELAAAVDRVREDALRARIVESLGQALDLGEVIARCAEAAAALHGVSGATVAVELDGIQRTASAGLGHAPGGEGSGRAGVVAGPPGGGDLRAVGVSYHYRGDGAEAAAVRSAIAVPLATESATLGFLTVFGRSEEPPVSGDDFATLEEIARQAGQAIEKAHGRSTAVAVEAGDPLTGLPTRRQLHETLAIEVARAHRNRQALTICILDLDDFKRVSSRNEGDAVLVAVAETLRDVTRPSDLAFRSSGDEFTVIMPDARRIEGEALYARLQAALRAPGSTPAPGVSLSAGIAEVKPDDDGVSLYERAERALRRAKAAGKGTAA
jgi:diguanylate cyclase (GGDEF)-like protein